MTARTLRLYSIAASTHVFYVSHRLKMARVYTFTISAQVVEFFIRRNRPNIKLVTNSMGQHHPPFSSANVKSPISMFVEAPVPFPTSTSIALSNF